MNILHILSQIELTGAEVYAVSIGEQQIKEGHRVFFISDYFFVPNRAEKIILPIHQRNYTQRLKNIKKIREILKEKAIDCVHAHSRAGSWVAYFAIKGLNIPFISTIHGYQKPSFLKNYFSIYGKFIISICEHLKTQLNHDMNIASEKINIIPNGINFDLFHSINEEKSNENNHKIITLAGRTTGLKGIVFSNLLINIFPQIMAEDPSIEIHMVGGDLSNLPEEGQVIFKKLDKTYPHRLHCFGKVESLIPYMKKSSLVLAAGRTAIEALSLEIPTIAIGEALYEGFVNIDNLSACIKSNFGDISPTYSKPILDYKKIKEDILSNPPKVSDLLIKELKNHYEIKDVYEKIKSLYLKARLASLPPSIPILMYHKILETKEKSKHKTFVELSQFKSQMSFLHNHNFTPITFKDYFNCKNGLSPTKLFPQKPIILTFDDGYKNNLQALPILKKYNFSAVIYVLGDFNLNHNAWDAEQGEPLHSLMTQDDIKYCHQEGIEIGCHGLSHRDLSSLSLHDLEEELLRSKENISLLIKETPISFAYPYGISNETIRNKVREAGFLSGVSTDTGGLTLEEDLFNIFRVNMMPRDTYFSFWKKTSSWYRRYYFKKRGQ